VACIVNHDVKSARISNDLRDAGFDRHAGSNVELDGPEIDAVLGGIARNLCDLAASAPKPLEAPLTTITCFMT